MIDRRLIYVLLAIGLLLTIFFVFKCQPRRDETIELIKAKDETLKALDGTIQVYKDANADLKLLLQQSYHRDSTLMQSYQRQQPIYIKLNDQLKDIPTRISSISNDDQLRAAFDRHK